MALNEKEKTTIKDLQTQEQTYQEVQEVWTGC